MSLEVQIFEEFYLKDLFYYKRENRIDTSNITSGENIYNYASRNSIGNGVVTKIDEYYNN